MTPTNHVDELLSEERKQDVVGDNKEKQGEENTLSKVFSELVDRVLKATGENLSVEDLKKKRDVILGILAGYAIDKIIEIYNEKKATKQGGIKSESDEIVGRKPENSYREETHANLLKVAERIGHSIRSRQSQAETQPIVFTSDAVVNQQGIEDSSGIQKGDVVSTQETVVQGAF